MVSRKPCLPAGRLKEKIMKEESNKKIENQIFKGRVVSTKLAKTATVLVERRKTHPLYKKSYAQSKKYLVQDDLKVSLGDLVDIVKCKPVSKNKHFRIIKVVGRDIEAIVNEELKTEAKEAIEEVMPEEKTEKPSDVSLQSSDSEKKENKDVKKPRKRKDKSES